MEINSSTDNSSDILMELTLNIRYTDPFQRYIRKYTAWYAFLTGSSDFLMCSYVYFIPRLIAFRCVTIGDDKKKPNFWMMTYLMTTVLLVAVSNICRCFNYVSEPTLFSTIFWSSTLSSFQQCITHLVLFICMQQLGEIESFQYSHLFLEGPFQHIYFVVILVVNLVSNFWVFVSVFSENGYSDADRKPAYIQDIGIPVITLLVYNSVRMRLRKERYYEQASGTDDGKPNVTDRMGKIAWYQGVMSLISIAGIVISGQFPGEYVDNIQFILFAQTPMLSVVSFVSILRKNRPTRPCFLLCCTEDNGARNNPTSQSGRVGISG